MNFLALVRAGEEEREEGAWANQEGNELRYC